MAERRRVRWRARWRTTVAALALAPVLALAGCGGNMDVDRVSDRIVQQTDLRGALVEVQHPGAPWNNEIVIWMFVTDASAPAVAEAVRSLAGAAAEDPDLAGNDLTVVAVEGDPADYPDRASLTFAGELVMAEVAGLVGGSGAEEFLTLSADDVRRIAQG